jgi:hypothetical protein
MTDNDIAAWETAVEKMTAQTSANEVLWRVDGSSVVRLGHTGGRLIPPAYVAQIGGRSVRVLEYEYEVWLDEDGPAIPNRDVAIQFLSSGGEAEWEFPEVLSRWKLLNAVRYQISDAGGFLASYLRAS